MPHDLNASPICLNPKCSPRRQYRLVYGVVGRALHEFESTKQLVTAVLDALQVHAHALEVVRPLHHDISAWNIILTSDNRGILIDWDAADPGGPEEGMDRSMRHHRTGTHQFKPLRLTCTSKSLASDKIHPTTDVLESFLRVLIWATLDADIRRWNYKLGPHWYPPRIHIPRVDAPLKRLLTDLCAPFQSLYSIEPKPWTDEEQAPPNYSDKDDRYDEDMKRLRSFDYFIDTIKNALDRDDDWPMPMDDKAEKTLEEKN